MLSYLENSNFKIGADEEEIVFIEPIAGAIGIKAAIKRDGHRLAEESVQVYLPAQRRLQEPTLVGPAVHITKPGKIIAQKPIIGEFPAPVSRFALGHYGQGKDSLQRKAELETIPGVPVWRYTAQNIVA